MSAKTYNNALEKYYGKDTKRNDEKKPKQRVPRPHKSFERGETLYSLITVSIFKKFGKFKEEIDYLPEHFCSHVLKYLDNPTNLEPVVDKSNPNYEDTLLYNAKKETFEIERFIYANKRTAYIIVLVQPLGAPIVPGSRESRGVANKPKFNRYKVKDNRDDRDDRRNDDRRDDDHDHDDNEESDYPVEDAGGETAPVVTVDL